MSNIKNNTNMRLPYERKVIVCDSIVDVYADNLLEEISRMSELLHTYNYVSMVRH